MAKFLPILGLLAFYIFLEISEAGQISVLLEAEISPLQTLAIMTCAGASGLALVVMLRAQGSLHRQKFSSILAVAFSLAPLVVVFFMTKSGFLGVFVMGVLFLVNATVILKIGGEWVSNHQVSNRAFFISVGIWLLVCLLVQFSPITLPIRLGSLFIGLLFVGLLAVSAQAAIAHHRIGMLIALGLGFVFFANEEPYQLRITDFTNFDAAEGDSEPARSPISLQDTFDIWLASRNDLDEYRRRNQPYPVFLIAAEGGGGYAAAHAQIFLSKMHQRCPNFIQHVFVLAGVSGGAVGNTAFINSLSEEVNPDKYLGCDGQIDISEVLTEVSRDNLSPLVATLLFRDLPNRLFFGLMPGKNRSEILIETFSGSQGFGNSENPYFLEHFWDYGDTGTPKIRGNPALIHIASDVRSGRQFAFTPFDFDFSGLDLAQSTDVLSWTGADEVGQRTRDTGLFDAAVASASFPYITPSLAVGREDHASQILVDGGYIDNSGAEVLLHTLIELRETNRFFDGAEPRSIASSDGSAENSIQQECYGGLYDGLRIHVRPRPFERLQEDAIGEEDAPSGECKVLVDFSTILLRSTVPVNAQVEEQSFFFDPVLAIMSGRAERAMLAQRKLLRFQCSGGGVCPRSAELGPAIGFYESVLDPETAGLALGWHLSYDGFSNISKLIAPEPDLEIEDDLGELNGMAAILAWQDETLSRVSDNPETVRAIIGVLNPD